MAKTAKGSGEDNRQKIIDAAIELITEKSVEKTSLAEIAKKTGLSKGTLYYYYATKNDLIFDITETHMAQITGEIFSMIEENGTSVSMDILLTRLFETLLSSETRGRLHLFLVREAISGNSSLKQRFQNTYSQWFSMVDESYDRMGLADPDARLKAKILVALLDGFLIQTLLDVEPADISKIVSHLVRIIDPA
ncbi:MAG: TetR/AcrR family transcriptional regulator [Desulfobacteraceae bacterium]|nr:TetR/AcrR family transcriptional regulator [Desulfobacteraceae bacterium]